MNETITGVGAMADVTSLALGLLGLLWLIFPFVLLRKLENISRQMQSLTAQMEACLKHLESAGHNVAQVNTSLVSIADALYITVRCYRCGKEVRLPSHCRGRTHPCPLCQTLISME